MKALVCFAFLFAVAAFADEGLMNKLLSPGPLIIGHKDLETKDCLKCHELNKGIPNERCLDCHNEIKKAVLTKHGFHGRTEKSCISCHSDHKGRTFDSTKVDPNSFNHNLTGYELAGKHARIKCQECHIEKRTKKDIRKSDLHYMGLATSCTACHKKDDPHRFKGKYATVDCNKCHGLNSWKQNITFDHDRDTSYKLLDKHKEVKCIGCHTKQKNGSFVYLFPQLKKDDCLTCHKDQHKGKFDKFQNGDCTKCHTLRTWKIESFNHDVTNYKLKGKHGTIQCIDCHKQTSKKIAIKDFNYKGLKQDCLACHDNFHKFSPIPGRKLGDLKNCILCHTETNWKSNFNHNKDTVYEISGKHIGIKCDACHIPEPKNKNLRIYKWANLETKTCENCHKNVHINKFSKDNLKKRCTECHVDSSWQKIKNNKFKHDETTRFPLKGRHKDITCASCHIVDKKEVYKFASPGKQFCNDCHLTPHKGQFSDRLLQQSCAECHNEKNYIDRFAFDHKNTRFNLTDKHSKLKCIDCHKATTEKFSAKPFRFKNKFLFEHPTQGFCLDCHKNVHSNQFHKKFAQKDCNQCHNSESFAKRLPFSHSETTFPLKGKHTEVQCIKCHTNTTVHFPNSKTTMAKFIFNLPPNDCVICHKDPHQGTFGKKCSECHQETTWKRTNDFHKDFRLNGIHFSLSCTECHKDDRRLPGMSENCKLCHQKDDVHSGHLPNCGECHRQAFWENPKFNHGLTRFALRGIHRTLDCNSCHAQGIYKGLPNTCSNCHLSQALSFSGSPNHSQLLNRSCSECHNQFSFR